MRFLWCLLVASTCAAAEPAFYSLGATSFNAMTHDREGNIYIAGTATDPSFPGTPGAYQTTYDKGVCEEYSLHNPCGAAFVIKLDRAGKVVFATLLGGSGDDSANSIALDSAGNVYLTGQTSHEAGQASDFPVTKNALFPHPGPDAVSPGSERSYDGFLAILSPDGSRLIYSTFLPSLSSIALALDSHNNIYVEGSPANPANETIQPTPGAFQTKPAPLLILKMKPGGTELVYATYLNSAQYGLASIAADRSGNLYVTGTAPAGFPVTPDAFQTKFPKNSSGTGFVAKLNASGTELIYATYLGGSTYLPAYSGIEPGYFPNCNVPSALKLVSNGDVWIAGFTCMSDFPTTAGSLPALPGSANTGATFLTKLNATGSALVYSTLVPYTAPTPDISGLSLDVDAAGRVYLLSPANNGFPVTPGAFQACSSGFDELATQFAPDGRLTGASYLGISAIGSIGPILAAGGGSLYIGSGQSRILKLVIDNPKQKNGPCVSPRIQNAANLGHGPIVPGEIILLNGYAIGPETATQYQLGPDGRVPRELAGVTVWIDGKPSPLLSVQSHQISAIVPWLLSSTSSVSVQVQYNGVSTDILQMGVAPADPGIFIRNAAGNEAAILNEDGTQNSQSHPAKAGSKVSMWGTGGGLMTTIPDDGSFTPANPPYPLLALPVQVNIDAAPATVLYAGAAPRMVSGEIRIDIQLPKAAPASFPNPEDVQVIVGQPVSNDAQFAYVWVQ